MKKALSIFCIALSLVSFAATQTSKEYVDHRDNEILSHANEYTDDLVSGLAHDDDIPTKVSQLQNDTGFVTGSVTNGLIERANSYSDEKSRQALHEAKQYTDNATNGQSKVISVNGRTGNVVLSSVDVHARPDNWMPSAEDVGAQPTLVSGTNIKTVNGNSLLGSGNIVIQGGGGGVDTNAVERIANAAVETNAVTVGLQASVSSLQSSKADKSSGGIEGHLVAITGDGGFDDCEIVAEDVSQHIVDDTIHISVDDREEWNAKLDAYEGLFFGPSPSEEGLYGFGFTDSNNRWNYDGFLAGDGCVWFPNWPSEFEPCYLRGVKLEIDGFYRDIAARPYGDYVPGNLAVLDENGDLGDSGIATVNGTSDTKGIQLEGGDTQLGVDGYAVRTANKIRLDGGWSYLMAETGDGQTLPSYIDTRISATDPTFSNAVLAVEFPTNVVAQIGELNKFIGNYGGMGATTLGGLLAALLAAVAALKKGKADKAELLVRLDLVGDGTAANPYAIQRDGAALDFASVKALAETLCAVIRHGQGTYRVTYVGANEMMWDCTGSVQGEVKSGMIHIFREGNVVQLVAAKSLATKADLSYPLNTDGSIKDRAINVTSAAAITIPDSFTDLIIRATVGSNLDVTVPASVVVYGDLFPSAAGEYLITVTKVNNGEAFVRTIKLEVAA